MEDTELLRDQITDDIIQDIIDYCDDLILTFVDSGRYFFREPNYLEMVDVGIENLIRIEYALHADENEAPVYADELEEDIKVYQEIAHEYLSYLEERMRKYDPSINSYNYPVTADTFYNAKNSDDEEEDELLDVEDDGADISEAIMVKRKISRLQSIINKRKRRTDLKWKFKRRMTLLRRKARGGCIVNKKLSKALKKSYSAGFGKRWESENMTDKDDVSELDFEDSEASEQEPQKKRLGERCGVKCGRVKEGCRKKKLKDLSEEDPDEFSDEEQEVKEGCCKKRLSEEDPEPEEDEPKEKKCLRKCTKKCKDEDYEDYEDYEDDDVEDDEDYLDVEDDEEDDSKLGDMKKSLAKKLTSESEMYIGACIETLEENFANMKFFGSMSEEDSNELKEGVVSAVNDYVRMNIEDIVEELIHTTNKYINEEVIPTIQESVDDYVADEVIPSIKEDVERYSDYVANEFSEQFLNEELIVQSPNSLQQESFINKLIDLIESDLKIMPEREEALVESNRKIDKLTESINKANIEKRKIRAELVESEKANWILKNTRSFSDKELEEFVNECEEIETNDMNVFAKKAKRILESMEVSDYKHAKEMVVESKQQSKQDKSDDHWDKIISNARTLL